MKRLKAEVCALVLLLVPRSAFALTETATATSAVPEVQEQDTAAVLETGEPETATVAGAADTAQPAQKPFVGIRGLVLDAATHEPLIEASVKVLSGGPKSSVLTDLDGRYAIPLPPGTYELRVFYELYQGRRISEVIVAKDAATELLVSLEGDQGAVEEVVVVARADSRKEAALLESRHRATTVSDAISAQEISRAPDSSASDAIKRVVSAAIIDGRYLVVRGLSGRYVSSLINGVSLPSPEPDEQAVPLDLFPSSLLSNLTVEKSYRPDLPGHFGGGALSIGTNTYPASRELKVKLSTSIDSATSFLDTPVYSGGALDVLGFDDGTRSLPDSVPGNSPLRVGSDGLDAAAVARVGREFSNVWSTQESTAPPNFGLSASLGDSTSLFGRRFGYLANLSYSLKSNTRRSENAKIRQADERFELREETETRWGSKNATLGGLLNFGLELAKDHQVRLFSLYTHSGEKRALEVSGYSETDGQGIASTRLQFLERGLLFAQLVGDHHFHELSDLELAWQLNTSVTHRGEPDTRDTIYNQLAGGAARFKDGPGSGERFYSELLDLSTGGGARLTLPLGISRISFGGSFQRSARNFDARRFRFDFVGSDPSLLLLDPEVMFAAENIGSAFSVQERTLPADSYDAELLVGAGFAALELELRPLRAELGLRYEVAAQTLVPSSDFALFMDFSPGVDRTDGALLPSASLNLALTERMNLRSAYSFTLARPQFRELAPLLYFDFGRRRSVSGNPELIETRIHNADLRWEWFFQEEAVLAGSVFLKGFRSPIEQVIVSASQGDVGFANAEGALLLGAELEARTGLGFVSPVLSGFAVGANLTLMRSEVSLDAEAAGPSTSRARPLQGQSPWLVNLNLRYRLESTGTELGAFYNAAGERIVEVGFDTLPDVYEEPFHRLDVSATQELSEGFALKLSGSNLLNQAVELTQGSISVLHYRPGVAGFVALEWTPQI